MSKQKILFLCSGNSCRSQMAEGLTRTLQGDRFEAFSAGVTAKGLDPRMVRAMAEIGVDVSAQTSKRIEDLPTREFDYVVTVCDRAKESCPIFPGSARVVHRGFDDPPDLAADAADEEAAMAPYRRVRDEILAFVRDMPASLEALVPDPSRSTAEAITGFLKGLKP